jgi:hypothetical protein
MAKIVICSYDSRRVELISKTVNIVLPKAQTEEEYRQKK